MIAKLPTSPSKSYLSSGILRHHPRKPGNNHDRMANSREIVPRPHRPQGRSTSFYMPHLQTANPISSNRIGAGSIVRKSQTSLNKQIQVGQTIGTFWHLALLFWQAGSGRIVLVSVQRYTVAILNGSGSRRYRAAMRGGCKDERLPRV